MPQHPPQYSIAAQAKRIKRSKVCRLKAMVVCVIWQTDKLRDIAPYNPRNAELTRADRHMQRYKICVNGIAGAWKSTFDVFIGQFTNCTRRSRLCEINCSEKCWNNFQLSQFHVITYLIVAANDAKELELLYALIFCVVFIWWRDFTVVSTCSTPTTQKY